MATDPRMEPIVLWPLCTDALGGLEVVKRVGNVRFRIGVVDDRIEELNHLLGRAT